MIRTLAEIPIGLSVRFSKTVSESDVYLFAGITGDFDPNHVDEAYCQTTPFGQRLVHGALLVGFMSAASSQALPHVERPLVSLGYDRVRFVKPVFFADTITVVYEITGVDLRAGRVTASVTVYNQHEDVVAVATHIHKAL
jgi:3-hydroxybutyryl-CoA dehydratase